MPPNLLTCLLTSFVTAAAAPANRPSFPLVPFAFPVKWTFYVDARDDDDDDDGGGAGCGEGKG